MLASFVCLVPFSLDVSGGFSTALLIFNALDGLCKMYVVRLSKVSLLAEE